MVCRVAARGMQGCWWLMWYAGLPVVDVVCRVAGGRCGIQGCWWLMWYSGLLVMVCRVAGG